MAATFDPALPTSRDKIRLRVFDCALADPSQAGPVTDPYLQDEGIDALIASLGYSEALAVAAESIAAELSRDPDRFRQRGAGGAEMSWSERVTTLLKIAEEARKGPSPTARPRRGIAVGRLPREDEDRFRSD